jgi:hypothetical protein
MSGQPRLQLAYLALDLALLATPQRHESLLPLRGRQ